MLALLAVCLSHSLTSAVHVSPTWELAFERGHNIWISRADGKYARLLIKNGDSPKWSPDGRYLAFVRGREVMIFDTISRSTSRALRFTKEEVPEPEDQIAFIDWDPKRPVLLISTESEQVWLVNLSADEGAGAKILDRGSGSQVSAPQWSPSGKLMAFAHDGDVWLAQRDQSLMRPDTDTDFGGITRTHPILATARRDNLYSTHYYDHANRIAAVAEFNDTEIGVSLATPNWATELTWDKAGDRIYFNFQRHGGSGLAQIGYVSLTPKKWYDRFGDTGSGFKASTHWLPLDDVFNPRVCPDGRNLSYVRRSADGGEFSLCVSDPEGGHERVVFKDVAVDFDWRPG